MLWHIQQDQVETDHTYSNDIQDEEGGSINWGNRCQPNGAENQDINTVEDGQQPSADILDEIGRFSKENSVILTTSFYGMNQKIWTKKAYFQNFSWFQVYIFKLCMPICVPLLP